MEKSFFSTLWKQKSNEWLSKAISDTANLHNIDTDYINQEIATFFMKFSIPDRSESEWYNEYIAKNESLKANFDKIAAESKITCEKVSFMSNSIKTTITFIMGTVAYLFSKYQELTLFKSLLVGVFIAILFYYFVGYFQNKANKRKAKALTDNVKRQLENVLLTITNICNLKA